MENIELAVITNIIDAPQRTFGFAKLASTGEQAYVGPNIFRQKSLELGSTIYCDVAENDSRYTDRGCNKRIVFVYDEDGPFAHLLPNGAAQTAPAPAKTTLQPANDFELQPKVTAAQIGDFIIQWLNDNPYFYTTADLVDAVNDEFDHDWDTKKAGPYLDRLYIQERIVQASVQTSPKNGKKSRVAWCHPKVWQKAWAHMMED